METTLSNSDGLSCVLKQLTISNAWVHSWQEFSLRHQLVAMVVYSEAAYAIQESTGPCYTVASDLYEVLHFCPSHFLSMDFTGAVEGLKSLCLHMQLRSTSWHLNPFASRISVLRMFLLMSCSSHSMATALNRTGRQMAGQNHRCT